KLALVQWFGLPTEDTSWENWDSLCADYHLEDKVSFPATGDVSRSPNTSIMERPKRTITRPKKLDVYVPTNAERLDDLTVKVDTILEHLANLTAQPPPPTPPPLITPPPLNHQPFPPNHLPRMKLDVPKFDGSDAMGWIFKISQFFDYHQTPEEERLTVASFYMEGPALSWYQWMHRNGQITTWFGFLQALETRFAPSYYDEPSSALFKLVQRTTVNQYLAEFERLA
ncbi:hypothetical protein L195_g051689, partial [Trifolium pratense]